MTSKTNILLKIGEDLLNVFFFRFINKESEAEMVNSASTEDRTPMSGIRVQISSDIISDFMLFSQMVLEFIDSSKKEFIDSGVKRSLLIKEQKGVHRLWVKIDFIDSGVKRTLLTLE